MVYALGLIPLSEERQKLQAAKLAASPEYRIDYAWSAFDSMPSLRWSSDYEDLLAEKSALREQYERAGYSLLPWHIFGALPNNRKKSAILCWNQGNRPSCSLHGAAHAFQAAELISIALGAPIMFDSANPIYNFWLGRGGNYAGGLDLLTVASEINERGLFTVSMVGEDNLSVTQEGLAKEPEAKKHQAGIVTIEDDFVERIIQVCKGLGAVCFGSGVYATAAVEDKNGMRVMSSFSRGGHAQAFYGYKVVNGTEYVWDQNSHGDLYGKTPNEPSSGAWVTRKQLEYYARDMGSYGYPMAVYAEGEPIADVLANTFQLPRL